MAEAKRDSKPTYSRGEKLSVEEIDLASKEGRDGKKAGFTFRGIFKGWSKSDLFVQDGQEKQLDFAIFAYIGGDGTGRFRIIADAGMKSVLKDGLIKDGDAVEIEKLGKVDMKGGRTMNKYDLWKLSK